MTAENPESDHPSAFEALSNKVVSLLNDVEPQIQEWPEKDLSKIKGSSNGVIRSIQYFLAPYNRYRSVRKEVDLRLREGWEGVQIVDSTLFKDGEQTRSGIWVTGYYVSEQVSLSARRAVWETQITPGGISDVESRAILGCIEGDLSNQVAAKAELGRFKTDH